MPHGPDIQQSREGTLDFLVPKQLYIRCRPRDIDQDLPQGFLFLYRPRIIVDVVVLLYGILVFGSFSFQGLLSPHRIGGQVPEHDLPAHAPVLRGDSVPGQLPEFAHLHDVVILVAVVMVTVVNICTSGNAQNFFELCFPIGFGGRTPAGRAPVIAAAIAIVITIAAFVGRIPRHSPDARYRLPQSTHGILTVIVVVEVAVAIHFRIRIHIHIVVGVVAAAVVRTGIVRVGPSCVGIFSGRGFRQGRWI
mmetsp:Transcript_13676/g.28676  ORF Transcript_13676/g.28676 Transcript_13676/m.28676 type:complete len:249 (+) Transcript_13676:1005-1751(+)